MTEKKYYQYIESERRFSPNTIIAYKTDIKEFKEFLASDFEINEISKASHQIIRSWVAHLLDNGFMPGSVNRKISTLRSYFKFLQSRNLIATNPVSQIIAVKQSRKLPNFIDQQSLNDELEKETPPDFKQKRDDLVVDLLYSCGMRLSELINLKSSSINKELNTVKVLGKRNKERLIPLSDKMIGKIETYNNLKEKEIGSAADWLIVSNSGKKAYPKLIYRIVDSALCTITQGKRSPHVLRHSFATHMLNKGAELNNIKELLGHSSLAATQVYTHNTIEQLKTIYSKAHPRAQIKKGG
ncbi:MAG: tyrosine-type recombinase/integrase [Chlorobi bacterium]|nr:tyrosine-type recombinase/integrase [Chlorobiota bacterium]